MCSICGRVSVPAGSFGFGSAPGFRTTLVVLDINRARCVGGVSNVRDAGVRPGVHAANAAPAARAPNPLMTERRLSVPSSSPGPASSAANRFSKGSPSSMAPPGMLGYQWFTTFVADAAGWRRTETGPTARDAEDPARLGRDVSRVTRHGGAPEPGLE